MIPLPPVALPAAALAKLRDYQAMIDRLGSYEDRIAAAKRRFSQYNKASNTTFQAVKATLTSICSGVRRCHYCEDSCADEVEHFRPKNLYPEAVFVWENYLYACGPCNGRKSNYFAFLDIDRGQPTAMEIIRQPGGPITAPPAGQPALIDPRNENPFALLTLDLRDTFFFVALPQPNVTDYVARYAAEPYAHELVAALRLRAEYTIRTLKLNRDILPETRRRAYADYQYRLALYIVWRDGGRSQTDLARVVNSLRRMSHPTVWREMQRQHLVIPELLALFDQAPEALGW